VLQNQNDFLRLFIKALEAVRDWDAVYFQWLLYQGKKNIMHDLHELPKIRDSLSYLYVEHAVVQRHEKAVEYVNKDGQVHIPAAALALLMLGPGTSITHAAIAALAENGCLVLWTGADGSRFYAQGVGETRKAYRLIKQATLASIPEKRMQVVLRMYQKRFSEKLSPDLTIPEVRGYEGVRVRRTYQEASKMYGVSWNGRKYDRGMWENTDPINRAISAANALLNGVCHAAILAAGYSPGLGFIHNGKQLSFVYDIADLYKTEITVPLAFKIVGESSVSVEPRVRAACREKFKEERLLQRILPDIDEVLGLSQDEQEPAEDWDMDSDPALPTLLWDLDEEKEL
jgi:CRISPR-associated protein Cas1